MSKRLREVSLEELEQIWDDLTARNEMCNGATHAELVKRYGDRLQREEGHGWYVEEDN